MKARKLVGSRVLVTRGARRRHTGVVVGAASARAVVRTAGARAAVAWANLRRAACGEGVSGVR
ncbi:hypothetical protein HCDSEM_082 [Candidatus Hodgkinia cicadicola Dsem]|nr:hypothetical protein HCDSEM_082 [Candidatus Hodgkinia cicadicola Dsem]